MADRYWVGGTATWDGTAGTKWATSSGGAGGASAPTTSDNVFFDANSTGSVTLSSGVVAANIDCTGFTGTWAHLAVTCTCAGTVFKLSPSMTYVPPSNGRIWQFTATSGTCLITTAGKNLGGMIINGAGGTFQLQDDLNVSVATNSVLTVTAGTFDANGFNVTVSLFSSTNSNTRTVTMGSGLWTLSGQGTLWNTSTVTNLTFNKGTANIAIASTGGSRSFMSGGLTFNGLSVGAYSGSLPVAFNANTRFSSLALTAPNAISVSATFTLTIDTAPTWTGSAANPIQLMSGSWGAPASVSVPSGTMSLSWAAIRDMTFTGGATFVAANSNDLKGNSGITITPPSSGGGVAQLVDSEGLVAA